MKKNTLLLLFISICFWVTSCGDDDLLKDDVLNNPKLHQNDLLTTGLYGAVETMTTGFYYATAESYNDVKRDDLKAKYIKHFNKAGYLIKDINEEINYGDYPNEQITTEITRDSRNRPTLINTFSNFLDSDGSIKYNVKNKQEVTEYFDKDGYAITTYYFYNNNTQEYVEKYTNNAKLDKFGWIDPYNSTNSIPYSKAKYEMYEYQMYADKYHEYQKHTCKYDEKNNPTLSYTIYYHIYTSGSYFSVSNYKETTYTYY